MGSRAVLVTALVGCFHPVEVNMNSKFGGFNSSALYRLRRARLIFWGGAATAALGVFVLLMIYSQKTVEANQPPRAANPDKISDLAFGNVALVVPSKVVQEGMRLGQTELEIIYWPRNEVPQGAIRDINEAKNLWTRVSLPARQPILRENVSMSPVGTGLARLVPVGSRAVTIDVDRTSGIEGWITPGAHVDVLLTHRDPENGATVTRTAVQDAIVISFQGSTEKASDSEPGKILSDFTVTLAVSREDALKIPTAKALGRMTLTLRNPDEPALEDGKGVFSSNVDWNKKEEKKLAQAKPSIAGFVKYKDSNDQEISVEVGSDGRLLKVQD